MSEMNKEIAEYYIKFKADLDGLKREMDQLKQSSVKDGEEVGKAVSKGIKKGLIDSLIDYGVFKTIKTILVSSVRAYAEQELAETRLRTSLGKTSKALLDQANALQKITRYRDEDIITVQSMFGAYEQNEDKIKLLTKATLDFAAAKKREGMDVVAAGELISKTYGSNFNSLKRYGIEVKGAAGSVERLKSITEELAALYGGQAEQQANTFSGRLEIMRNKVGEVQEGIGKALIPVLEKLVGQLDTTAEAASKSTEWMQVLGGAARVVANIFTVVKTALVHVGTMIGTIGASLYALFSGNFSLIPGIVKDGGSKIVQNFSNMWTEITDMWKGLDQKFAPEMDKIVRTHSKASDEIEKREKELQEKIKYYREHPGKIDARSRDYEPGFIDGVRKWLEARNTLTRLKNKEFQFQMKEVNQNILDNSMMTTEGIREDWENKNKEILKHFDLLSDISMRAFDEIRVRAAATANATTRFWVDMANMIINKLKEIAAQALVTFAINSLFSFLFPGAAAVGAIASTVKGHSGGNFIGTSNGVRKLAGGGSFIVPPGFPNDTYPLLVESGERVSVTSRNGIGYQDRLLSDISKKLNGLAILNSNFLNHSARRRSGEVIPIAGKIEGPDIKLSYDRTSKLQTKLGGD